MVAEWFRAPAISSREEGDVGSSPSPAKITFSDEIFLNNSRVRRIAVHKVNQADKFSLNKSIEPIIRIF